MFSLKQDALLLSLRPIEGISLVPNFNNTRTWSQVDAELVKELYLQSEQAFRADPSVLTAGAFRNYVQSGECAYLDEYTKRREMLKRMILGACVSHTDRYVQKMGDLIYLIAEESDWSLYKDDRQYPDFSIRKPDVNACETGALLALCLCMMGAQLDRVSPLIGARIRYELGRRLIEPMITQEGELLNAKDEQLPAAVAALMTVTLVDERDERRRWLCLRRLIRILESYLRALPEAGGFDAGLNAYVRSALCIDDCFAMLGVASGGEVELRDEALFVNMARVIVGTYIGNGYFINPGGDSATPDLSADQLYRLGGDARLQSLCSLAACLFRREKARAMPSITTKTEPLMQSVMAALGRKDLTREAIREPLTDQIELPGLPLLAARMEDFYVAITGVSNQGARTHMDVGDIALFYQDQPVVLSDCASNAARDHSVPRIGQTEQQLGGDFALDSECREGPGYRMLSMNIAPGYPRSARLQCYQRTLMLASFEGGIRLMDVFDFDGQAQAVTFRFITCHMPVVSEGQVVIGPIVMTFDPMLTVRFESISSNSPRYRLELTMPDAVHSGNYAFVLRPLADG